MTRKIILYLLCLVLLSINLYADELPKIELGEDKDSFPQQISELIKDYNESKSILTKSNKPEIQSIDLAIEEYAKTLATLEQQVINYNKSNDPADLKAAAYTIDLLSSLITETYSTIPGTKKLSTKSINFEELKKIDKIILQEVLADINKGKILTQKNVLFYLIELESLGYSMKDLMTKIDEQNLGFEDLSETIAGLDFDAINVENMDLGSITDTFESLEQLNIEQVTKKVSESIAETTQAIEQATEQVIEVLWENYYSVSEILGFINNELDTNVSLYEYNILIGELYVVGTETLWGGSSGYQGQNSWADAVADYNSKNNTNLSPEEALSLSADVICFYSNC